MIKIRKINCLMIAVSISMFSITLSCTKQDVIKSSDSERVISTEQKSDSDPAKVTKVSYDKSEKSSQNIEQVSVSSLSLLALPEKYFRVEFCRNSHQHVGSFKSTNEITLNGHLISYPGFVNLSDFRSLADNTIMNDRAEAVHITGTAGTRFWFFRHADGPLNGGFCELVLKQDVTNYFLDSFERNYDDTYVSVRYWNSQDLDGEISSMQVAYQPIF